MSSLHEVYRAKAILRVQRHCDGGWFWHMYSATPYSGCEFGCEYCYQREEKYYPHKYLTNKGLSGLQDPFSQFIRVKQDAPAIFERELKRRPRDLICLGSYQPAEAEFQLTHRMLQVCLELGFPVFINEKSPLVLRDIDLLEELGKQSYVNVGWSIITTRDDETRQAFEPGAPPVAARFRAMKELSKKGIVTGTVFMPILPFIYDDENNIEAVVRNTVESGGRYVLDAGLTLFGSCKTRFYKALQRYRPTLIRVYEELYGDSTRLARYSADVHRRVVEQCERQGLLNYFPRPVSFYPEALQINKRVAGDFYLKARELQFSSSETWRAHSHRRAAWALDDMVEGVDTVYRRDGLKGLEGIRSIGQSFARRMADYVDAYSEES